VVAFIVGFGSKLLGALQIYNREIYTSYKKMGLSDLHEDSINRQSIDVYKIYAEKF